MFLPRDSWQVKKTKEKGFGVFAQKEIAAGAIIGDYLGKVIRTAEYDLGLDKKGLYLMYYSDLLAIYPDLKKPGLHLINHSCAPNCWIYMYKGHTLFFALRDIKPGEELTISYLLSPKDETCNPCFHICKCGNTLCTGTMHLSKDKYDKWQTFQTRQQKKTRRAKAIIGQNLPPLTAYPKINPNNPIYSAIISS